MCRLTLIRAAHFPTEAILGVVFQDRFCSVSRLAESIKQKCGWTLLGIESSGLQHPMQADFSPQAAGLTSVGVANIVFMSKPSGCGLSANRIDFRLGHCSVSLYTICIKLHPSHISWVAASDKYAVVLFMSRESYLVI